MIDMSIKSQQLPNLLTWLRVALVPVIVFIYFLQPPWHNWLMAGLFTLAGLTDWLDGYVARVWQVSSKFGEFLDPIADKLIVICCLLLIHASMPTPFITLAVMLLIAREIIVLALRQWLAQSQERGVTSVSFWGKCKTFVQFFAICFLLWQPQLFGIDWLLLGQSLLLLSVIFSLSSLLGYFRR